jgi:hypothetical protein
LTWRLHPATAFASLAPQWDALNETAGGIPFLASVVVQSALTHFGTGDEQIAVREEGGKVTCAAILQRTGVAAWQLFQPSQLPLGSFLQRTGASLVDASPAELFRSLPGWPLTIGLTQLDPNMVPRPDDGPAVTTLDYITTAWVEVSGDFESYWANRGKNLRDNVKKLGRKVTSEGMTSRLEEITDPAAMRSAVADYARLETAGWKSSLGTAVSTDTAQGRFYVDMMERMAALQRARAYRYWFDDNVVTMDLCVQHGDVMVVLKTSYDERFAKFSPATLMREEIFRQIFAEQKIRRVEFYGPMMDWHTRWTEHWRTLYHANVFRSGMVRRAIDLAKAGLRRRSAVAAEASTVDAK